jgi:hypothetical protein
MPRTWWVLIFSAKCCANLTQISVGAGPDPLALDVEFLETRQH